MNLPASHNQPEYTVSEISGAVKRVVEDTFGHVRVRGEISGLSRPASGHVYFSLKDDKAVLKSVCWKGVAGRLACAPADGLEVICTGRLTTWPGSSNYQLVVESMEPAGVGALLAQLEALKKKLAAEGLFAEERKKPIPFLPRVIGVVTSPTGAVIQDILHRVSDRFPCHVLVWPVPVQGQGAAEAVAAAIAGFNALPGGDIPRPDVLIVARGGGSLEDLWAFNEEIVARAAAASEIPLISAIGHETDVTLLDFVADLRAPTPTGAAERAVPVRAQVLTAVSDHGHRLNTAALRRLDGARERVEGLSRGLPRPVQLLETAMQRVDVAAERLGSAWSAGLERRRQQVVALHAKLPTPSGRLAVATEALNARAERLARGWHTAMERRHAQLEAFATRLRPDALSQDIARRTQTLNDLERRLNATASARLERAGQTLARPAAMLETLGYHNVLARGYAVVRNESGHVVTRSAEVKSGAALEIEWQDGKRLASAR